MTQKQERIWELAGQGLTRNQIAKELGVSYAYISQILRGIHKTDSKKTPTEKVAELRRLQARGYTPKAIATELGMCLTTVYRYLRKNYRQGIHLPHKIESQPKFFLATPEQRGIWLGLYIECIKNNTDHVYYHVDEASTLYWYEGERLMVWGA